MGMEDTSVGIPGTHPMKSYLSFTMLCDNFIDNTKIDGLDYTDEMDCEKDWPCNNIYTLCDGKWHCRNAIDEANCPYNPCRPNGHPCILPFHHNFTCLPLSRINDGRIDCVGGYDEQDRCGAMGEPTFGKTYRCFNETQCIHMYDICDSNVQYCSSGDDQDLWCKKINLSDYVDHSDIYQKPRGFDYEFYRYQLFESLNRNSFIYFTLKNHLLYPPSLGTVTNEYNTTAATAIETVDLYPFDSVWYSESKNHGLNSICNRGIPVYVNNFSEIFCLCPPAYFGYRCEYQNQRISLTLQFRTVEFRTVFTFIIMLIDDNTTIHSSEQHDYVSVRDCSLDSICIGVVSNRSICVCPLDKFGPRCYLMRTICDSHLCSNNSRCIPHDEKNSGMEYYCLCSQGYMGSRCENLETKIEFHFAKRVSIPQTIFFHFVYFPPESNQLSTRSDPIQVTTMSKLKFDESSTIVYYGGAFHLVFVEFHQQYYLALLQYNFTSVINTSTSIIPEHRCLSIKDLFTDDVRNLPRWHRAKKYHIPCQKHSKLVCFYDKDYFMCLCDIDRYPNCFKFDYSSIYRCLGYNYCENNGQCFQDNNTCPTSLACLCKECYYGSRCQFTTTGFGLSLDDVLGYNIWPNVSFLRQPTVVKITTAFTVLMFVIAIINGILSIITFQTKRSLEIGSGLYLLTSSITSLITMTLFTVKYFLLIFSQMSIITNYSFLLSHCVCIDMLLKAFSAIGEWLNACVSIERALTIRLGVKFNKVRSRKAAKRVIFGLYLFILTSFLHDPLSRRLLEDSEEQRTWCVVRYSSPVRLYASIINFFHFLLPLCINFFSILLMIVLIARRKSKTTQAQTHRNHLWEQFH
ncbi:unnamed protein product [Rotaria sp. Silwood2]|nr:unnamed protein product [Rotaria sp. Silwood2]CAF4381147.1 unnamed protein product [Rotaria sp. Silwood2]